jgi:exosortase family protein XrtF
MVQKDWLRFIFLTTLLGTTAWLVYEFLVPPENALDHWLNYQIATLSSNLLEVWGYNASLLDGHIVCVNNQSLLSVGSPCNGLKLYAVFAIFIIGFMGSAWHKLWFIPVGIIGIFSLNVLRVALLSLNVIYFPSSFDFNHRYLFEVIVYGFIFLLWVLWSKKLAPKQTI